MLRTKLAPWRIPALTIFFSLVPFAATVNRLIWLNNPDHLPDPTADRFVGDPLALVLHILIGSFFLILAAFQFSPELRTRYRARHRYAGRVAGLFGFIAALTGIWLIVGFPMSPMATVASNGVRLFFSVVLGMSIILAIAAARRRDFAHHRAWMVRAFAIGVAGSTQAVLLGTWVAIAGTLTPQAVTVLLTLGFAINIAIAEARIRKVPSHATLFQPQRNLL